MSHYDAFISDTEELLSQVYSIYLQFYKTKQEFYLYLLITEDGDVQSRIYYKQKQLDELRLVIGQILKQTNLWKLQLKS